MYLVRKYYLETERERERKREKEVYIYIMSIMLCPLYILCPLLPYLF